jgi:predicted O-methyltransferase YrrM
MRRVITKLLPSFIKRGLRSAIDAQTLHDRRETLRGIPRQDLAERHVANLKVFATRGQMLAHLPPGAVAAEIGVSRGKLTNAIMTINPPRKLHLVDVWNTERYNETLKNTVAESFAGAIDSGAVEINRGFSTEVGATFPDGYFDWIYIDTDHSYETTRKELAIYEPKMNAGGIIAGHDFVMGNWRDGIKYGVIEAVYEFCVGRNWELIYLTMESRSTNPSFAIRKIRE